MLRTERYQSTQLLGQGGMAEVFRAWDHHELVWCALKVLRQKYAKQPSARQRFVDEGRTVIALEHRNVIQAWDIEARAKRPFLVMEIAEGGSLKDWVDRHGQMSPRMAVDVAIQISKGIGAAHRQNVVHRDVKPHNILLTRRGACKVTDFGIARIFRQDGSTDVPDATIQSQNAMGTLGYMAPEQRTDPHSADVRTDVYGIGATLFTLLTGNVVMDLFIAEREPQLLDGIPEALVPVLRTATAYRPDQRYDNVRQLAKALFEARDALPMDPPAAPPLVGVLPPEPPPPVALTPVAPTPAHARRPVRPSPPMARRRPQLDFAHPEPRTRPLVVLAALAGLALAAVVLDAMWVRYWHMQAMHGSIALVRQSRSASWIVDFLPEPSREPLNDQFQALQNARHAPAVSVHVGSALVQDLRGRVDQYMPDASANRSAALSDIAKVDRAEARLVHDVQWWRIASEVPCLAVCLGMAEGVSGPLPDTVGVRDPG